MAFQAVPQCASAFVEGTVGGKKVGNVLHFRFNTAEYDQDDIDNLALALNAWADAELKPLMPSEAGFVGVRVRGLANQEDYEAVDISEAGVGALAVENLPVNVTFAIKFGTGTTGRSRRGRAYVWGIPTDALGSDENTMDTGRAEQYRAAYAALNDYTLTYGWFHAVVSRQVNNTIREEGIGFGVTSYSLTDLVIDTQRRRITRK